MFPQNWGQIRGKEQNYGHSISYDLVSKTLTYINFKELENHGSPEFSILVISIDFN